ncbi:DNA recombination protein RmuC [Clostridia bacterium]|nr:DNA recombination protein RmuC [Clostridia bacterium]
MDNSLFIMIVILAAAVILLVAVLFAVVRRQGQTGVSVFSKEDGIRLEQQTERLRTELFETQRQSQINILEAQRQNHVTVLEGQAAEGTRQRTELGDAITKLRSELSENMSGLRTEIGTKLADQALQSEQKLENIRLTMETRMNAMRDDNTIQLDRMREVVDEKLQKTLNDRISESFRTVQEQLLKVSEGLGEMQVLAADVGGLKNVLSNVKTKGILGEYQLGAILAEILSKEQYEENIATKPGSADRVEFAIKLPGDGEETGRVYLPIDAKFPSSIFETLQAAYETGDARVVEEARKSLSTSIKQSAKTIHDKYVEPPYTTDFAILFLPTEGLYAEAINCGLSAELQTLYKVNIAGPTTMAALLNSLQMGFKTLAIQKRSSEVWNVLSAVKTEFANFEKVLKSARTRLEQADRDLEKLIGTRTNAINRKLRSVATLDAGTSAGMLDLQDDDDDGIIPAKAGISDESDDALLHDEIEIEVYE